MNGQKSARRKYRRFSNEFRDDLAFKAEPPMFIYRKKRINKRDKTESVLEVVKNVLIGIKGLLGS